MARGLALSAGILSFDGRRHRLGDVVPFWRPAARTASTSRTTCSRSTAPRDRPRLPVVHPVAQPAPMGPVIDDDGLPLDPAALGSSDIDGGDRRGRDRARAEACCGSPVPVVVKTPRSRPRERPRRGAHENYLSSTQRRNVPNGCRTRATSPRRPSTLLTQRDVPAAELASALLVSSRGRHLMAWWEDKEPCRRVVGARSRRRARPARPDGLLPELLGQQAGLVPAARLGARRPACSRRATTRRADGADAGPPGRSSGRRRPTSSGRPRDPGPFVTAHLPAAAYDISTTDPSGLPTKGVDGPMQVRTFLADVPRHDVRAGASTSRSLARSRAHAAAVGTAPTGADHRRRRRHGGRRRADATITWLAGRPPEATGRRRPRARRPRRGGGRARLARAAAGLRWRGALAARDRSETGGVAG